MNISHQACISDPKYQCIRVFLSCSTAPVSHPLRFSEAPRFVSQRFTPNELSGTALLLKNETCHELDLECLDIQLRISIIYPTIATV